MREKTFLASLVTLLFMGGFVFATLTGLALAATELDLWLSLALGVMATGAWSILMWLVSPWIMDLMQAWVYRARPLTIQELGQRRPRVAEFIGEVCAKHRIKLPTLKLIDDGTPQAYCYGSYANNARLVTTRGLFEILDDEELKAVYGHELGHIVHRDFIVMTIASTLLNILWNIYIIAKNVRGKNNSRPGYPIALVALVFYWISQYLLLFLSRTREYYADQFSGAATGNPNALSLALVKIAYGLTQIEKNPYRQKLLGGVGVLGIADSRSATGIGYAYTAMNAGAAVPVQAGAYAGAGVASPAVTYEGVRRIEKVMLFDLFNPWATVSELGATHPLTGKRIRSLGEQARAAGQRPLLAFEQVDAQGAMLDRGRLWGSFLFEVTIYFLPYLLGAMVVVPAIASFAFEQNVLGGFFSGLIVAAVGLGMTIKGFYSFPSLRSPTRATVLELMSDPYASPLKGRPVILDGVVTGRADAGNQIGEDFMVTDAGGGLMMINYESPFGRLGNWWFAMRRVGSLIQQPVRAVGWFRRGISQQVDLKRLESQAGGRISSYTAFWGKAGGVLVMLLGVVLAAGGAIAAM